MPPEENTKLIHLILKRRCCRSRSHRFWPQYARIKLQRHHVNTIMELLLNDAEVKRKRGTYEVTNFKCAAFVTMLLV